MMFSYEICGIFKNTHFEEHLRRTAYLFNYLIIYLFIYLFISSLFILGYKQKMKIDIPYRNEKIKPY